jgi:DNA-binding GntR family transcriptional regulator
MGPVEQPRYLQLARLMRADIDRGVLQVSDRLPGEREICRRFGVSRTTVRRALEELQSHGYVRADGTRGWFVTPLVEPNALLGFTDLAAKRGLEATSRVLTCTPREATLAEGDELGAPPGAQVLELERVRLLGGVPVGWQRAVAAAWLAPSLVSQDYATDSLYSGFRADGIVPARADYDVRASTADKRQAKLLDVPIGASVLLIKSTTWDEEARRIEVSDGAFAGERYRFRTSVMSGVGPEAGSR